MARLVIVVALFMVLACGTASAVNTTAPTYATPWDALNGNRARHMLLWGAAQIDATLKSTLTAANRNVTLFLPTDTAILKAATQLQLTNANISLLVSNQCLVRKLLAYHTLPSGGRALSSLGSTTTALPTAFTAPGIANGRLSPAVARTLRFQKLASSGVVRAVGAGSTASVVAPYNVPVVTSGSYVHTVDMLLLPGFNLAAIKTLAGC